jgi:plasmid stabilization system protein ParE
VILKVTNRADVDLSEIWIYNADRYGIDHADKYHDFLLRELGSLLDHPTWGKEVEGVIGLLYTVMKMRSGGHGHTAYYQVDGQEVRIVRILHTSMRSIDHLQE